MTRFPWLVSQLCNAWISSSCVCFHSFLPFFHIRIWAGQHERSAISNRSLVMRDHHGKIMINISGSASCAALKSHLHDCLISVWNRDFQYAAGTVIIEKHLQCSNFFFLLCIMLLAIPARVRSFTRSKKVAHIDGTGNGVASSGKMIIRISVQGRVVHFLHHGMHGRPAYCCCVYSGFIMWVFRVEY